MAMNRETKRMLQRQGELGPDGEQQRPTREAQAARRQAPRPQRERTGPAQFGREVRGELRKVAWPTRAETARLSGVVLVTIVILTSLIFGLDYVFAKFVFYLFSK
jgi:preprotein translocase subunit SecE